MYRRIACLAVLAALVGCNASGGSFGSAIPTMSSPDLTALSGWAFSETWNEFTKNVPWVDGSAYGSWLARFNGYGTTQTVSGTTSSQLQLSPAAALTSAQTHASLVTTVRTFSDFDATVSMRTVAQLRASAPQPWEAAWFLWHVADDRHFYYLILKPNGWELGKEDPAYPDAQRFLATGSRPAFPVGSVNRVHVSQRGARIAISVNGAALTAFTDLERPYTTGSLGLYCEDSVAQFGSITVK